MAPFYHAGSKSWKEISADTRCPASKIVFNVGKSSPDNVAKKDGKKVPKLAFRLVTAPARSLKRVHSEGIQTHPPVSKGQKISHNDKSKLNAVM